MERAVEREWLDYLEVTDSLAQGSRGDLRKLNWCMGNRSILAAALAPLLPKDQKTYLHEMGAGDGDLLSRVAQRLGPLWKGTRTTLIDRQEIISTSASDRFREAGWSFELVTSDVFNWCQQATLKAPAIVVANLFLHHLDSGALSGLFKSVAQPGVHFVALEPRRSWFALACSRFVGLIGCNSVTRHDAPASVRAGFYGNELSELWPCRSGWDLQERRAGLFGHLFVARWDGRG